MMELFKSDPGIAAKKALAAAEKAAADASTRATAAEEAAATFAREASAIDPDDAAAFAKAVRELTDRRATADLWRARAGALADAAEKARTAFYEAERREMENRLAEVDAEVTERMSEEFAKLHASLEAFWAEAEEIEKADAEGRDLALSLKTPETEFSGAPRNVKRWPWNTPQQVFAALAFIREAAREMEKV